MLTALRELTARIDTLDPWTNVYGLARTLIALGSLLTLAFNPSGLLFRPLAGAETVLACEGVTALSLFCLAGRDHLETARWACVVGLIVIASGWRPRLTGLLHWWIAFSFNSTASTLEGGDQAAMVLTFILIPITLTDSRVWHWARSTGHGGRFHARAIAHVWLFVARVQVAMIYFHASVGKMLVPEWTDGTAPYYWFSSGWFRFPDWTAALLQPLLTSQFVFVIAWGTILLELAIFLGLFLGLGYRRKVFVAALAFHASIALLIGLWAFGTIMAGCLVLLLWDPQQQFTFNVAMLRNRQRKAMEVRDGTPHTT